MNTVYLTEAKTSSHPFSKFWKLERNVAWNNVHVGGLVFFFVGTSIK